MSGGGLLAWGVRRGGGGGSPPSLQKDRLHVSVCLSVCTAVLFFLNFGCDV